MTTNKAIETLRKYQRWRRGQTNEMISPAEIGEAIDAIIGFFSHKKEKRNRIQTSNNTTKNDDDNN